jgi:hypothetical protein
MAIVLYPNGETKEVQPRNGTDFQLDELQSFVEGHIEIVPLPDGRIMVINEEGRLLDLPRNEQATQLAQLPSCEEIWKQKLIMQEAGYTVIDATLPGEPFIAGTVLVCENEEVQ